jgi:hypothetical protein
LLALCSGAVESFRGTLRRHRRRGGQAPVAGESDRRKNAKFWSACDKRLRRALATLAHDRRRWNPRGHPRQALLLLDIDTGPLMRQKVARVAWSSSC